MRHCPVCPRCQSAERVVHVAWSIIPQPGQQLPQLTDFYSCRTCREPFECVCFDPTDERLRRIQHAWLSG